PLRSLVDPDDPALLEQGDDMPARLRAFCAETGQPEPDGPGAVTRCVLESLALKQATAIGLLTAATGTVPAEVHVVGGGAQNDLLCRLTASASGLPALAGPEEATEIGNLLLPAMARGGLASLADAREVGRASSRPPLA